MSDQDVLLAIEEMERRLRARHRSLDSVSIQEWKDRFQAAVASAERGKTWDRIVHKAQIVQRILEQILLQIMADKEAAKYGVSMTQTPTYQRLKSHRLGRS